MMVAQEAAGRGGDWYEAMQEQLATNIVVCQARRLAKMQWEGGATTYALVVDTGPALVVDSGQCALAADTDSGSLRGGGGPDDCSEIEEKQDCLPQHCTIVPIERGGWCFYDCFASHVQCKGANLQLDRVGVAALALDQLILQHDRFELDLQNRLMLKYKMSA